MQVHMKNLNKNFNQKKDTNLIWTEIQKEMKSKFGSEIYESWLKKIYFEEQHSNYLVVSVSTRSSKVCQPSAPAKIALKTVAVHNKDENIAASAFSRIS